MTHHPCLAAGKVADVAGAPALPSWRDVEQGAPELARLGMAWLNSARVALLGALRRDGSPASAPSSPTSPRPAAHRCHGLVGEGKRLAARPALCAAQRGDRPRQRGRRAQAVWTSGKGGARTCPPRQLTRGGWPGRRKRRPCSPCTSGRQCSPTGISRMALMTIHRWSPRSGYVVASGGLLTSEWVGVMPGSSDVTCLWGA